MLCYKRRTTNGKIVTEGWIGWDGMGWKEEETKSFLKKNKKYSPLSFLSKQVIKSKRNERLIYCSWNYKEFMIIFLYIAAVIPFPFVSNTNLYFERNSKNNQNLHILVS